MQNSKLCFACLLGLILWQCKADKPRNTSPSVKKLIVDNLITNIQFRDSIKLQKDLLLTDESGKTIQASTLVAGRNKLLFFYYSKSFCDMCFDREMQRLSKIKDNYSKEIIILLSVDNKNDVALYKERHHSSFKFYSIGTSVLSTKLNLLFRPYYFVADGNLNTSMLFIPDKNIDEPTEAYFKAVFGN